MGKSIRADTPRQPREVKAEPAPLAGARPFGTPSNRLLLSSDSRAAIGRLARRGRQKLYRPFAIYQNVNVARTLGRLCCESVQLQTSRSWSVF